MKKLIFIFFAYISLNAQSIVIGSGAELNIGAGTDVCAGVAGTYSGTITGTG